MANWNKLNKYIKLNESHERAEKKKKKTKNIIPTNCAFNSTMHSHTSKKIYAAKKKNYVRNIDMNMGK